MAKRKSPSADTAQPTDITNYDLRLTKQQAGIVSEALELYMRIGMGQLEEIVFQSHFGYNNYSKTDHKPDLDFVRGLLDRVKYELHGLERNAYLGIHGTQDRHKVAYDIYQVIRHRISWDQNPQGGFGVNFDEPMRASSQPLPEIKKV